MADAADLKTLPSDGIVAHMKTMPIQGWTAIWSRFGHVEPRATTPEAQKKTVVPKKLDMPARRMACREVLEKVPDKEKAFLHAVQKASWKMSKVLMQQVSPESYKIGLMLYVTCRDFAMQKVQPEGAITEKDLHHFSNYVVKFWCNMGNYDMTTGRRFIPELPLESFEKVMWRHSKFLDHANKEHALKLFNEVKTAMYAMNPRIKMIGGSPDVASMPAAGMASPGITPEEYAICEVYLRNKGIRDGATRICKADNGALQIWLPMVDTTGLQLRAKQVSKELFMGRKVMILRGDYEGIIHNAVEEFRIAVSQRDKAQSAGADKTKVLERAAKRKDAKTWQELASIFQDQSLTMAGSEAPKWLLSEVFHSLDSKPMDWYGLRKPMCTVLALPAVENEESAKVAKLGEHWRELLGQLPWPENKVPDALAQEPRLVSGTALVVLPVQACASGWMSLGEGAHGSNESSTAGARVIAVFPNIANAHTASPASIRKGATEEELKSKAFITKKDAALLDKVGTTAGLAVTYLEAFAAAAVKWCEPVEVQLEKEAAVVSQKSGASEAAVGAKASDDADAKEATGKDGKPADAEKAAVNAGEGGKAADDTDATEAVKPDLVPWVLKMQSGVLCTTFEHFRSASTGLYLALTAAYEKTDGVNPLEAVGVADEDTRKEVADCALLQVAQRGLTALGRCYFDSEVLESPDNERENWSCVASAEQARFALFSALYEADSEVFKLEKDAAGKVTVSVDASKITSSVIPALRSLLALLHDCRVSADLESFRQVLTEYSMVTNATFKDLLSAIRATAPAPIVMTQMHLTRQQDGKIKVYEFEPSLEGVLCSVQHHMDNWHVGCMEGKQTASAVRSLSVRSRGKGSVERRGSDFNKGGDFKGKGGADGKGIVKGGMYPTASRAASQQRMMVTANSLRSNSQGYPRNADIDAYSTQRQRSTSAHRSIKPGVSKYWSFISQAATKTEDVKPKRDRSRSVGPKATAGGGKGAADAGKNGANPKDKSPERIYMYPEWIASVAEAKAARTASLPPAARYSSICGAATPMGSKGMGKSMVVGRAPSRAGSVKGGRPSSRTPMATPVGSRSAYESGVRQQGKGNMLGSPPFGGCQPYPGPMQPPCGKGGPTQGPMVPPCGKGGKNGGFGSRQASLERHAWQPPTVGKGQRIHSRPVSVERGRMQESWGGPLSRPGSLGPDGFPGRPRGPRSARNQAQYADGYHSAERSAAYEFGSHGMDGPQGYMSNANPMMGSMGSMPGMGGYGPPPQYFMSEGMDVPPLAGYGSQGMIPPQGWGSQGPGMMNGMSGPFGHADPHGPPIGPTPPMYYGSEVVSIGRGARSRGASVESSRRGGRATSIDSRRREGRSDSQHPTSMTDIQAAGIQRTEVKDLTPDHTSVNMLVRCVKVVAKATSAPLDPQAFMSEAEVGDESGVIKMRCTAHQAKTLSVGFAVLLQDARIDMDQGFMRLEVNPGGCVKTVPGLKYFMPNRKYDMSMAKWELVND